MLIKAVDAKDGTMIAQVSSEGTLPGVMTGDIFVVPEGAQFRVLQRAYILTKQAPRDGILGGRPQVDVELQLAVCPIGMEAEYAE